MKNAKKKTWLTVIAVTIAAALMFVLCACAKNDVPGDGTDDPVDPPAVVCEHPSSTPSVTRNATCVDDGERIYVCDSCHETVRTEVIPAVGHDYSKSETTGLCGKCNTKVCSPGLTYTLGEDRSYYIVSDRNRADGLSDLVIPEYHEGKPVKEIAGDAFTERKYIKSVSIPATIVKFGAGAFSQCNIQKLYYNAENASDLLGKNWLFYSSGDAPQMDVMIGKAVRHIPARLFYPNNAVEDARPKLKSVTFESGGRCESIGEYAFYKTVLKSITFPDTLKAIGNNVFESSALESVSFGAGLESIGAHAFDYCIGIDKIDLSVTAIKRIEDSAFKNCFGITDMDIPQSTELIGPKAFYGCGAIGKADIKGAKRIEDFAFYGCAGMTELTLPQNLENIGSRAFEGCSGLTKITVLAQNMNDLSAGNRAFYGAGAEGGVTVVVGDGVENIPSRLFFPSADADACLHIKSLSLPSSLKSIGDYAFRGATVDSASYSGSESDYATVAVGAGNTEIGTPTFGGAEV